MYILILIILNVIILSLFKKKIFEQKNMRILLVISVVITFIIAYLTVHITETSSRRIITGGLPLEWFYRSVIYNHNTNQLELFHLNQFKISILNLIISVYSVFIIIKGSSLIYEKAKRLKKR